MADTEEDNPIDCSLHKCIFEDDYRKLSQLIRTHDVGQKDKHGKYRQKRENYFRQIIALTPLGHLSDDIGVAQN